MKLILTFNWRHCRRCVQHFCADVTPTAVSGPLISRYRHDAYYCVRPSDQQIPSWRLLLCPALWSAGTVVTPTTVSGRLISRYCRDAYCSVRASDQQILSWRVLLCPALSSPDTFMTRIALSGPLISRYSWGVLLYPALWSADAVVTRNLLCSVRWSSSFPYVFAQYPPACDLTFNYTIRRCQSCARIWRVASELSNLWLRLQLLSVFRLLCFSPISGKASARLHLCGICEWHHEDGGDEMSDCARYEEANQNRCGKPRHSLPSEG